MATTLNRLMKTAAASLVIRLANRTNPRRNYTTATRQVFQRTSTPTSHHHFCALAEKRSGYADGDLIRVAKSEEELQFPGAPKGFPFNIVDNAEDKFIRLTREYQGEEIEVEVEGPKYSNSDSSSDDEDEEDQDDKEADQDKKKKKKLEESNPPYVWYDASVSKKNGLTLEFTGWADADGFRIRTVGHPKSSDYYGSRDHNDEHLYWGKNLRKAFHSYLKVRGFEPSVGKFLCDYMVQRKKKKYSAWLKNTTWLKNLKSIVSK